MRNSGDEQMRELESKSMSACGRESNAMAKKKQNTQYSDRADRCLQSSGFLRSTLLFLFFLLSSSLFSRFFASYSVGMTVTRHILAMVMRGVHHCPAVRL